HNQFCGRNTTNVAKETCLHSHELPIRQPSVCFFVTDEPAAVCLRHPARYARLTGCEARIKSDNASMRSQAFCNQAKQILDCRILQMVDYPKQQDRIERRESLYVCRRQMLTKELPSIRIVLFGVEDITGFDIQSDVIHPRHVLQDMSWPAADIENTLSASKLEKFVQTNSPEPVCGQNPLPSNIAAW